MPRVPARPRITAPLTTISATHSMSDFNASLPWHAFASSNVYYGSGFTNGSPNARNPGPYLPGHTTFDASVGKSFGEKYSVSVTAIERGTTAA